MRDYKSVFFLVLIMTGVTLIVGGAAILILYETAMTQERVRLADTARSQAVLVDAVVAHELALGESMAGAQSNAVRQIALAHIADGASTPAGAFNLARRDDDAIVFLVRAGQPIDAEPLRVPFEAPAVEPMRRALLGEHGLVENIDYFGERTIAAHEPVSVAEMGIVATLDLAELRAPFIKAALAVLALALVIIALGTTLFVQISTPMIEHLRASERRFRDLFDSMSSGVAVLSAVGEADDFVFTDLNPAGERIDQVERGKLVGRPISDVFPGAEASGLLEVLRRVWRTGTPEPVPARFYEDERIRGWRESFVYRLPGGEVVELFDDVSERMATEEQLRQAQKMEVVGQLTGGVAHDFNNLLAIILGNLQLLHERLGDDAVLREFVVDALWSAERGAELTHRLLAFARRQPLNPVVTDVNVLIRDLSELVERTLASSRGPENAIVVERRLDPGLWRATVDHSQLESALMNLIVNARDAMPGGGTLTLDTRNVVAAVEGDASPDGKKGPGEYVVVGIRDTGVGIASANIERIFEPFFTTKRPGEGSGLGLSMVYGFAKQSGGHVEVESEYGAGTTVRLYLPRADEAPGAAVPTAEAAATPSPVALHAPAIDGPAPPAGIG
ncbi:MAG: PAS domain-containing protein [Rhodospirillales bacterium]|nr:PAS domain-containing protein [Rhodospirillales bacterium]